MEGAKTACSILFKQAFSFYHASSSKKSVHLFILSWFLTCSTYSTWKRLAYVSFSRSLVNTSRSKFS